MDTTAMSGVTDEQRVAAWRDRYGRVAFAASWQTLGQVPPPWEGLPNYTRGLWGSVAEAVIDAFVTGELAADRAAAPSGPRGTVGGDGSVTRCSGAGDAI